MNIRNFENHHPYISLPLSHIIKCKRTTLKLFFFWRKWKYQHLQPNPTQWKFTVKLTNNPNTSPNRGYITWPLKLRTPRLNPTQHAQCRTQSSGLTNTDTKISPLLLDPPPPDHPKIYLWVQISHPSLSLSLLRGLLALECWRFLPSICSEESSTTQHMFVSVSVYLNYRRFVHIFRLHDPVRRERGPRDLMLLLLPSMWGSSSLLFRLPSKRHEYVPDFHSHAIATIATP